MDRINKIIDELRVKNYENFDIFYNMTKNQVFYAIITIVKDKDWAEDIMQDTYVRFLEKIDQYKQGANPYVYLATIARNLAINDYNREKRIVVSEELISSIPSDKPLPDDTTKDIFKILSLLDDDEREVVTLRVINNLKFREISAVTNKPLGTVLWIYNKAIKKLQAEVGDKI